MADFKATVQDQPGAGIVKRVVLIDSFPGFAELVIEMGDRRKLTNQEEMMTYDQDMMVARVMFGLAYDASDVVGMGIFAARNHVHLDDIMGQVRATENGLFSDYIFGRMVKLAIRVKNGRLDLTNEERLDPEYQSWCRTYPTIKALYEAAEAKIHETAYLAS